MARRRPADDRTCRKRVSNVLGQHRQSRSRRGPVIGGRGAPVGPRWGVVAREPAGPLGRGGGPILARDGRAQRLARDAAAIPLGSMRKSPCDAVCAGAILSEPSAPGRSRETSTPPVRDVGIASRTPVRRTGERALGPRLFPNTDRGRTIPRDRSTRPSRQQGPIERMDAKQVWRAALGELQVSLSPANYETWLRDTQLVDVDEQRFRIAVPNGFAKDWLETRYRSLISQTLARIVGYSVQVEFVVGPPAAGDPALSDGAAAGAT